MSKSQLAIAVFFSVLLHGLLVAGAVWGWGQSHRQDVVKTPNYIKAKLVEMKPKAKAKTKKKAKKKVNKVDLVAKRKKQERLKKEAEKKRQLALKKKQAEEKKRAEEQKKREAEKKAREEEQRKKAEQLKQQQALDEEFDQMLLEEEQMMLEQEYATEAQSYIGLIQQRVANKFIPPPSARKGMEAKVAIRLVPTGRIVSANIVESSGNDAFDRAARQAVLDVEEFSEVKDMPSVVFERYFRTFSVVVKPQGLRL